MPERPALVGRDQDVSAVVETLRGVGPVRTLAVTGAAGSGKTALLKQACRLAVGEGVTVRRLAWESADGEPGVPALVDAVCRVLARIHDGRLPMRIAEIRRAELLTAGRDGGLAVLSTVGRMLADAAHYVPFALVLDDCERMPAPTASALGLLLRAFRPAGLPVVMACRSGTPGHPHGGLLAAADRVLGLAPLTADEVRALVGQRLGRLAEPEVSQAVMRSLGPQAGNPQALLSVLGALIDDAGLLELDGRIQLVSRQGDIRLSGSVAEACRIACPGLPLEAGVLEAAVAVAHMTGAAELRLVDVQDMARRTLWGSVADAGAVDRLVTHRVLTVDRAGSLSFAVPALAAALRTSPPPAHLPAMHAHIVASVVDRLGPTAGVDQPRLAEHVVAAGALVDRSEAARLLLAAAGACAAGSADRAARACLAALRRLPSSHPEGARILRAAAVLARRAADPATLLALGEPLLSTAVEARPGAVPADLADPATAWGLAALYEHLWPDGDGAEPWTVVRQMPAGPELAALGSRYGLGPARPEPEPERRNARTGDDRVGQTHHLGAQGRRAAAADAQLTGTRGPDPIAVAAATLPDAAVPVDDGAAGGPLASLGSGADQAFAADLPTPAQLRLLAAAVSGGDGLKAARAGLPPGGLSETALETVRTAAGYGDLAGAFAALVNERCRTTSGSVAEHYHAMVGAYETGRWKEALSCARRIEAHVRGPGPSRASVLARVLAAEIHCATGNQQRALAWLDQVPDTVSHPLGGWVRLGVRYRAGNPDEAFDGGWRDAHRARENGLLEGLERLLVRLFQYGCYEERPETAHRAMAELEALHEESASPQARRMALLARSVLRRDPDRIRGVLDLARERGDEPLGLLCLELGAMADDAPEPWLAAAVDKAHQLGVRRVERSPLGHRARMHGLSLSRPRRRAAGEHTSELDLHLVELVSDGATNRQIAVRLACSEKTVEQHLTRLFRRTGCRSRSELAAARLDGRLARLGLALERPGRGR